MHRTLAVLPLVAIVVACGGEGEATNSPATGSGGVGGASSTAQGGASSGGNGGSAGSISSANGGNGGQAQGGAGGVPSGSGGSGGSGGNGGSGGAMGNGELDDPCTWGNGQCNGDLYCDATGCGAGTCQPKLNPASQQQVYDPQCGCDGVNYFNPTIAETFGAAISHTDECTSNEAVVCDTGNNPCASGQRCSVEVANVGICAPGLSAGVCWGAPITCGAGQPMARGCIPPGDCANKCALIRSQNGWFEDVTCQ